jgi:LPXTG-motif cell wall-anchored protein
MKRIGFGAGFAALVSCCCAFLTAAPAHAAQTVKVLETDCKYVVDIPSGTTADLPPATSTVTSDIPAQVETGQGYDVNIAVKTEPAQLPFDVTVDGITIDFVVTGGATPTSFQGKIAHAVAHPGDVFDFGSFHAHLTAPASPGTVTVKIGTVHIDKVTLGASEIPDVSCTAPDGTDLTLGATGVVPTAPPGAPTANPDAATTDPDKPVTVDVLANDTPSDVGPIDVSSLAVAAQGTKGNAGITDGKLVYKPKAGATGTDTVRYQVCTDQSQVQQPGAHHEAAEPLCDQAVVTITISSPTHVGNQGGGTGTNAASTTTTTAAKELPRTGQSTGPNAAIGFGAVGLGAAALYFTRRRRFAQD